MVIMQVNDFNGPNGDGNFGPNIFLQSADTNYMVSTNKWRRANHQKLENIVE